MFGKVAYSVLCWVYLIDCGDHICAVDPVNWSSWHGTHWPTHLRFTDPVYITSAIYTTTNQNLISSHDQTLSVQMLFDSSIMNCFLIRSYINPPWHYITIITIKHSTTIVLNCANSDKTNGLKTNQQVTLHIKQSSKAIFIRAKNVQADAFGWSVLLFLNVIKIQFKRSVSSPLVPRFITATSKE